MCGLLLLLSLGHCVWSPVLLIQCVDDQDWCSSREQKRGGRPSWILCHQYASQLAISPLLPVGCLICWGAVYRARNLFQFKWNNKCETRDGANEIFSSQPLLSNARSADFSSMKVTKLCYEKYFVLLSNHNLIGSKDLKLVSNRFER